MKKAIMYLPVLFFTQVAFTQVTSVEQLIRTIDEKKLENIEQILPEFSSDLRSNFVLAFQSSSLQGATYENPRAIMYGKDAKFLVAFNGDPALKGYNKIEMIQFNEAKASFDFYSLDFPLQKDSSGKVPMPQRNPQSCMGCHSTGGVNPHPIWHSYLTWPGFYGQNDDIVKGDELVKLKAFLDGKTKSERYKVLTPPKGADIAPFSPENLGNLTTRPNFRLAMLLGHLQAKQLARLFRESKDFRKYAPLFVYEDEANIGTRPFVECDRVYSPRTLYGFWTSEDASRFAQALEAENIKSGATKPIPAKWDLVASLFHLLTPGTSVSDWNLSLKGNPFNDYAEFFTGLATMRNIVLDELKDDFERDIPEIKGLQKRQSLFERNLKSSYRLMRTPQDIEYVKTLDSINQRGGFLNKDHCAPLLRRIKKDWLGD